MIVEPAGTSVPAIRVAAKTPGGPYFSTAFLVKAMMWVFVLLVRAPPQKNNTFSSKFVNASKTAHALHL